MAVHIEFAELDETRKESTADGVERFTMVRISNDLGKRSLPATLALRLLLHFRTEPGRMSQLPPTFCRTPERAPSQEKTAPRCRATAWAQLAIDIPVMFAEPGPYTVHCIVDGTPWSQIISLDRV